MRSLVHPCLFLLVWLSLVLALPRTSSAVVLITFFIMLMSISLFAGSLEFPLVCSLIVFQLSKSLRSTFLESSASVSGVRFLRFGPWSMIRPFKEIFSREGVSDGGRWMLVIVAL